MASRTQQRPTDQWIGCLTYKSRATTTPTPADIKAMVSKARARNREMGITGMLLFEDGCFLQTLEGPPDQLDRVWNSIKRDPRHRDIQVLSEHIINNRLFSAWDLMLYDRQHDTAKGGATTAPPPAIARSIKKLVQLALDGDDLKIDSLLRHMAEQGWTPDAMIALLIEPAARQLGDAWLADQCTELDLTIALSMLQMAGHAVRHVQPGTSASPPQRYSILLATAPGEQHKLGTSLLADQFIDAGWHVDVAFPDSMDALVQQVRAMRPDAIDIGLSDALPRRHSLVRLSRAIEQSRAALPASPMVISVGGRLFAETAMTAMIVGADHARTSVIGATVAIADLVRQRRAG